MTWGTHDDFSLGIALASQGQIADAPGFFERAVQLRPGFADAVKNRDMARRALANR